MEPKLQEARRRTKNKVEIKKYALEHIYQNLGFGKTYYIKTYGCQMNEHDSENIAAILEQMGFMHAVNMEDADLILLNTCAIRENAHNKVFGMIGRVKHLKEQKPHIMLGLCGCMMQEESVIATLKKTYPFVDFIFGTHNIHDLPKIFKEAINSKKTYINVLSCEGDIIENMPAKRVSKYKAWVNIMYGCDKFCTYCIVPYTRGKQRSRMPIDILDEVKSLIAEGYKEITLLGQNVNAYGKDLDINYNMANLLEDTAKLGIERIRFVTSHPWDFTDEMIEIIGKYKNIMPYIHLPLQSGSNKILKLMGRRYTKESYMELFDKIKKTIPNVSVTTDIIVGFPNETEQDFQDTLDVVNYCKYDSAFTFIFSPRIGTPAAKMADDVTIDIKNKRLYQLNDIVNKYSLENNKKYINKVVKVLIEGKSDKDNMYMGYSEQMKLINVECSKNDIGKIIDVEITDAKSFSLNGKKITK